MSLKLSYDQELLLTRLIENRQQHFLILGPAGCGKSLLRKEYVRLNPRALLLGTTGASIADTSESFTVARFIAMKRKFFSLPPTVIIEECSMLDATELVKLNQKLKSFGTTQPFGGVQLLFFGDVLQLPPVTGKYFFTSNLFKNCNFQVISLKENFRQQDQQLKLFCHQLRYGKADTGILLEYRRRPPLFTPTICATKKWPKSTIVDPWQSGRVRRWLSANIAGKKMFLSL